MPPDKILQDREKKRIYARMYVRKNKRKITEYKRVWNEKKRRALGIKSHAQRKREIQETLEKQMGLLEKTNMINRTQQTGIFEEERNCPKSYAEYLKRDAERKK